MRLLPVRFLLCVSYHSQDELSQFPSTFTSTSPKLLTQATDLTNLIANSETLNFSYFADDLEAHQLLRRSTSPAEFKRGGITLMI